MPEFDIGINDHRVLDKLEELWKTRHHFKKIVEKNSPDNSSVGRRKRGRGSIKKAD